MQNILGLVLSTPVLVTGVGFPFPVSIPMALSVRSSSISFVKLIAFPSIPLKFCLLHSGRVWVNIWNVRRVLISVCWTEDKIFFLILYIDFKRWKDLRSTQLGWIAPSSLFFSKTSKPTVICDLVEPSSSVTSLHSSVRFLASQNLPLLEVSLKSRKS